MAKCFACNVEIGLGGIVQENGNILCFRCDEKRFQEINSPVKNLKEPPLRNLAQLVDWIFHNDEKSKSRIKDLRKNVKNDPLPGLKVEILQNLLDNPDLLSLREFLNKLNEFYPLAFEQAQIRTNAGGPIGDETAETWSRIVMLEPWLSVKLCVLNRIVMKMSIEGVASPTSVDPTDVVVPRINTRVNEKGSNLEEMLIEKASRTEMSIYYSNTLKKIRTQYGSDHILGSKIPDGWVSAGYIMTMLDEPGWEHLTDGWIIKKAFANRAIETWGPIKKYSRERIEHLFHHPDEPFEKSLELPPAPKEAGCLAFLIVLVGSMVLSLSEFW